MITNHLLTEVLSLAVPELEPYEASVRYDPGNRLHVVWIDQHSSEHGGCATTCFVVRDHELNPSRVRQAIDLVRARMVRAQERWRASGLFTETPHWREWDWDWPERVPVAEAL